MVGVVEVSFSGLETINKDNLLLQSHKETVISTSIKKSN